MLRKHSTSFSIRNPIDLNVSRVTGPSHPMDPKSKTHSTGLIYRTLTHMGHNESNPSRAPFCAIPEPVDPTMLPALNEISTQQSKPTALIINKCNRLLDYAASYPDAVIRYHVNDMILYVDTDAAYIVLPKSRSRIAGHFYLSDHPPSNGTPNPKLNGPILTICQKLKHVVASAAEAETGGMFFNGQAMVPIRYSIIATGHSRPDNVNPLKSDSKTGVGIVRSFMEPKCSKSWDMRYHWLEDRTKMGHLNPYWERGLYNWAGIISQSILRQLIIRP